MNQVKNNYTFVLKSIKKYRQISPTLDSLKNKTYIVSGGTRGIGFNIAKKLAMNGANVSIIGKTKEKHPKLQGTIYTSAEEINNTAKRYSCVGIPCDIRDEKHIKFAVDETIDHFGKPIDGVILNASALCLNDTLNQTSKEVQLMSDVNINGTYLFGQHCLKRMKYNKGHILMIAPPIDMLYTDEWWTNHLYYSMSKFNMSLMAKYWNKEFPKIAVNTLWPRTTINTAPVQNLLGGDEMVNISRKPDIMGDAAKHILASEPSICNGMNFIDDEVLASLDIDLEKYRVNKDIKEKDLMPDFFC